MPQVKCEYCGAFIDETADKCPNCGAVNANFKRIVSNTPATIEELKDWYKARNLPDEYITRFFIGKNVEEPKAYGIYKEGSDYIVYKNKADGSRAIRYRGTDEAYAVNEIYLKLKSEILDQKSRNMSGNNRSTKTHDINPTISLFCGISFLIFFSTIAAVMPGWVSGLFVICAIPLAFIMYFLYKKRNLRSMIVAFAVFLLVALTSLITYVATVNSLHKHDGYYYYGPDHYYVQGHDVYYYDNDSWEYYDTYDDFGVEYGDFTYESDTYDDSPYYDDFKDSNYYDDSWESSSSSSSDWSSDSDYDWDSGSDWDSDSSDWDSDW